MTEDMIGSMKRYRAAKERLEEQAEIGRQYVESVKADVEQDLEPLRREVEAARSSIEAFIREENGGEKFKVPGLGTAFLSKRRKVCVVDEGEFLKAYRQREAEGGDPERYLYEYKLVPARVKTAAERVLEEDGEIPPGVEAEQVETLSVRLSTPKATS